MVWGGQPEAVGGHNSVGLVAYLFYMILRGLDFMSGQFLSASSIFTVFITGRCRLNPMGRGPTSRRLTTAVIISTGVIIRNCMASS